MATLLRERVFGVPADNCESAPHALGRINAWHPREPGEDEDEYSVQRERQPPYRTQFYRMLRLLAVFH